MTSKLTVDDLVAPNLKEKVYTACRDGLAISVFAMLWNIDRDEVLGILAHHTDEGGQITTPLIIAARNGEEKVVQILLKHFSVDTEQTGTVKFDGYTIECATSLWCSSGAGHFAVVKALITHGASVNHPTKTNSTPLRAACFDGRLDIVKFLVDNGADLTIANKSNNTCLMISTYKGHHDVVEYLLSKNADPDCIAHCGATALHFAAECGHLEITKLLIKFGASIIKNDHNMNPLSVAAECGKESIVEYLTFLSTCTRQERIDALELLGASYANDKETYDIAKAFKFLKRAMELRFEDSNDVTMKTLSPPVAAYDNKVECRTLDELEAIRRDFGSLHMESLAIRERILGTDNPEIPHPVIFRGAVFADIARFDRCIALWMHALKLRQRNNRSVCKDLLRFSQVFSQMVHVGASLAFGHVQQVLQHCVIELQHDVDRIERSVDALDADALIENYHSNIHASVYLLIIILKLSRCAEDNELLHRAVYSYLKLKPSLKNGYGPIHMAVDSSTLIDDFHVNDVVAFPNSPLVELLVKCGADVNVREARGNTPLHIIVCYNNPIDNFDTLHKIILLLIHDGGAHLDVCNTERKTPMMCATTGVSTIILRTQSSFSLKCLAAKAIRTYDIPYRNIIPETLDEFVQWH